MENSKTGIAAKAIPAVNEQQRPETALLPLLAGFLKGNKGGRTGCKLWNFKREKKS